MGNARSSSAGSPSPTWARAEAAALGSVLLDNGAWWLLQEVALSASDFQDARHGAVFEAMGALIASKQAIDPVTLGAQLGEKLRVVGGLAALAGLAEAVPTSANAKHYGALVKGQAVRRALRVAAKDVVALADDEDQGVQEVAEAAVERVLQAGLQASPGQWYTAEEVVLETYKRIESETENGRPAGIPTGLGPLDELILGLPPGVHIIGARPSMGKTALAGGIVGHVAQSGGPVGVFLLESTREAFMARLLSARSGVPATVVRRRAMDEGQWERFARASSEVAALPLGFCDDTGQTVASIRARCRAMQQDMGNLALVMVDYLQLVNAPEAERRQLQLAGILRGFKDLAKDLRCPVLLLSQVDRSIDKRPNKRPGLADLREAGDIEQDADLVFLLYREGYYAYPRQDRGEAEVIVAKNRDGEVGTVKVWFEPSVVRFFSAEPGGPGGPPARASSPGRL